MINTLLKLGLSDKEAKVYLAALELGASSVQKIALKAKINRATTYVILESLRKKGLTTSYDQGKKAFFSAEPPQTLDLLVKKLESEIKEKRSELGDILPELKAIFNAAGGKPKVRFYEGKEGIEASRLDADSKLKKGDHIYAFNNLDLLFGTVQDVDTSVKDRIKKDETIHVIYTREEGPLSEANSADSRREARFIPKEKFPFNATLTIIPNVQIRIATYQDQYVGVVIEDAAIANSMKAIWDLAWEAAEKYNK